MSYETYAKYRDAAGLTDYRVAKLAGFTSATFTEWKNGRYTPKEAKRKKIADVLGITLAELDGDVHSNVHEVDYYIDPETAQIAQEIYDTPELHMLFDAARDVPPEDLVVVAEMVKRMKRTNPDG